MKKEDYKIIQDIRERLKKGEPTTFQERNILNIYNKRLKKKDRDAIKVFNSLTIITYQ
jgi:hypothetical protein